MKQWTKTLVAITLLIGSIQAQFAEGQPALRGAIGPAFSFMLAFELEDAAFGDLGSFTLDFDITNTDNGNDINKNGMLVTGFEGFGEVTPHWTIGMYAGQGEYSGTGQDATDVDYYIDFIVSQVGVTAEFNTHSRSRLKLLGGSLFGIGQVSLSASSSPDNEDWSSVVSGTVPRSAFELSAFTPVIQPYVGFRFDISRSMGFKAIAGWNEQVAAAGSWKLYHQKAIADSPEVALRALFFRSQLYVIL